MGFPSIDFEASNSVVFTFSGQTYRAEIMHDEFMGAPWKKHCGHGLVSDWITRAKRPGERVLTHDRGSYRYYDIQAATKIAKWEGWNAEPFTPCSDCERAARAVEADFQNLRKWCMNEWS